jgi:hypothetical protein
VRSKVLQERTQLHEIVIRAGHYRRNTRIVNAMRECARQ